MSDLQKIIKYLAMGFAAFLAFTIITGILTGFVALTGAFSGIKTGKTTDINRSFDNVTSISAEPGFGTLRFKEGDSDQVEVIAENVSENFVVEKNHNGKLTVKGKYNFGNIFGNNSGNGKSNITIYLPSDFVADDVKIEAGAGNINIEELTTKRLDINAGAGNISGKNITASQVDLDGGVGDIDFEEVNLSNADIDCGVGNINLQGYLLGRNKIDCGVGEVDLTLKGSVEDYNIKIDKGLGNVSIDGQKYSEIRWNNASTDNSLDIDGGVGNIEIEFE